MTDRPPSHPPLSSAMDQALDWLIVLGSPSEQQTREFHAWLAADPRNAEAFAKAQAIWDGPQVAQAALGLSAAKRNKVTLPGRLRPHWKPLAITAVLILGLFSFSNLPMRIQADHLTVVRSLAHITLAKLQEFPALVILN